MNLRRETRLGKKNKDEGLYFCSKKILEFVFILWKKDEAFDPNYQDKNPDMWSWRLLSLRFRMNRH